MAGYLFTFLLFIASVAVMVMWKENIPMQNYHVSNDDFEPRPFIRQDNTLSECFRLEKTFEPTPVVTCIRWK